MKDDRCSVRICMPDQLYNQLKSLAHRNGLAITGMALKMLHEEVANTLRREKIARMNLPPQEFTPSFSNTPFNLFSRGFTVSQIAAKLHMPYEKVYREIGSETDRLTLEENRKTIGQQIAVTQV